MTFLEIVETACNELGLLAPTTLEGTTDLQTTQLKALVNRDCQGMYRQHDWTNIQFEHIVNVEPPTVTVGDVALNSAIISNIPSTAADLNETSLENAVIQIAAWTDERGLLIAAKPRKLVVPPNLMFTATRLLQTELRVATADNDVNALKMMGSIPEGYTVNHYLTDTNAWFLTTDVPNG